MRVLYYIPYLVTTGADHWIYQGWKHAFEDLGHQFFELTAHERWEAKIQQVRPALFFIPNFVNLRARAQDLIRIRAAGIRVFLVVDWPMREEEVRIIRDLSVADVFFGEREHESMQDFEARTGRRYHLIPNAADARLHFPTAPVAEYAYDIVYLGAKLPKKRRMFEQILLPLTRRYRVGIFGPYWTLRDNVLRAGQKFLRWVRFAPGVYVLNRMRIVIPPEEENQLYSSAKICVNFHEREEDGSQPHYIVNQRTFKIPACGGFQICDYVPAVQKYFAAGEVVLAGPPEEWFEKVDYYLTHEDERRAIRERGTRRALADHTYHNRVQLVLRLYAEAWHDLASETPVHSRSSPNLP